MVLIRDFKYLEGELRERERESECENERQKEREKEGKFKGYDFFMKKILVLVFFCVY